MIKLKHKKTEEIVELTVDEFVSCYKEAITRAFWKHIAGEINSRIKFMNAGDLLDHKEEDLKREVIRQSWLKMAAREAANRFWKDLNLFNMGADVDFEIVSCEDKRVFNVTINELEQLHPDMFVPEVFTFFTEI